MGVEYSLEDIETKAEYYGEMMIVLESDREYDFHQFTVTTGQRDSYEVKPGQELPPLADGEIRIEGMKEDEDGDLEEVVVDIPVGRIEHVYTHREA
jgi:hypothetical protein